MRTRITELFGVEVPIVQAPMAGCNGSALAIEVAAAGALGSLPCAMLSADTVRDEVAAIRAGADAPVNLNFFCHAEVEATSSQLQQWLAALDGYYEGLGLQSTDVPRPGRRPFDDAMCGLVEELRPEVVSFHFGLPHSALMDRVLATGAVVVASATSVEEALFLQDMGCAAVIAQGVEAGGHQGMFLRDDISAQMGTMALVPLVVDAVQVPVIAAGGITDARGIAAAFVLGADAVQLGTAYLLCPEATTTDLHRRVLAESGGGRTVLTNVFTGRPARGIVNRLVSEVGPMSSITPPFPLASGALGPLRAAAEAEGSTDFSPLWSGQAGPLAVAMPARELTRKLIRETEAVLAGYSNSPVAIANTSSGT